MSFICDKCGTDDCDNCKEYRDYEIKILNYWDDPNFSRIVRAQSAGEAKYKYWTKFSDCYTDMNFGDFLKITRCRSLG